MFLGVTTTNLRLATTLMLSGAATLEAMRPHIEGSAIANAVTQPTSNKI
ncbi:MAG TPA: hypothetical protein V6D50_05640 [Chroococcales cyanobacterium]